MRRKPGQARRTVSIQDFTLKAGVDGTVEVWVSGEPAGYAHYRIHTKFDILNLHYCLEEWLREAA